MSNILQFLPNINFNDVAEKLDVALLANPQDGLFTQLANIPTVLHHSPPCWRIKCEQIERLERRTERVRENGTCVIGCIPAMVALVFDDKVPGFPVDFDCEACWTFVCRALGGRREQVGRAGTPTAPTFQGTTIVPYLAMSLVRSEGRLKDRREKYKFKSDLILSIYSGFKPLYIYPPILSPHRSVHKTFGHTIHLRPESKQWHRLHSRPPRLSV